MIPGESRYRPIVLLNTDYKILAAILAKRLNNMLGNWIHPDQTGFLTNRQMRDNIHKVLNIIDYLTHKNIPMILFLLMQKKLLID